MIPFVWIITGGAGYIGGTLVKLLEEKDIEYCVFDNLSSGAAHRVPDGKLRLVDIRNISEVVREIQAQPVEGIVHLAASKSISDSLENSSHYYDTNVTGTANLAAAASQYGITRFIFASSCAVYGEKNEFVTEKTLPIPSNVYGSTKLESENLLLNTSEISALTIFRFFNVIGQINEAFADLSSDSIVNKIKDCIRQKKSFTIYGGDYRTPDGTCIRDFIDVRDVASAILKIMRYPLDQQPVGIFNLGTGSGISILEFLRTVDLFCDVRWQFGPRRSGDVPAIFADTRSAKEAFGFNAKFSLRESLLSVIGAQHQER